MPINLQLLAAVDGDELFFFDILPGPVRPCRLHDTEKEKEISISKVLGAVYTNILKLH